MADRRRARRRRLPAAALALAAPLALVLPLLLVPVATLGAEGAGASCPDLTPGPNGSVPLCEDTVDLPGGGGAGGAGIDLGALLPFAAAAIVGGAIALGIALLVLRRRVPPPLAPAGPGEWWVCGSCGATNISGSPRCYSCGAWGR